MALKVAKGSVVAHDLEAVVGSLKGASRAMTTITALPDVTRENLGALRVAHRRNPLFSLEVGHRGVGEDDRFENSALPLGVKVDEAHVLSHLRDRVVSVQFLAIPFA